MRAPKRPAPALLFLVLAAPWAPAWAVGAAADLLHWSLGGERLVLVGEVHGTREIPAMLGDLASLMVTERPVVVGLELPAREQGRIDAFLASDGTSDSRSQLLQGPFWTRSRQDGRSSEAMLNLIERLRTMRREGRPVTVLAFDASEESMESDDAAAAERIRAAYRAEDGTTMLILLGNYRASLAGETPTLGSRLLGLGPLSVDVTAWRGSYWTCDHDSNDCGPRSLAGSDSGAAPMLHTDADTRARGFASQLILGAISMSPPALGPDRP